MTPSDSSGFAKGRFRTTRWSLVAAAATDRAAKVSSSDALQALCETYWYPVYAFIRRPGHDSTDAQDLTQGFFTYLIENDVVAKADPDRGRFRSFLLTVVKQHLSHERDRANAKKRGGGERIISIDWQGAEDRYRCEPADAMTPEDVFERRRAMTVLDQAVEAVEQHYRSEGKQRLFDALKPRLVGDANAKPYGEIADELVISIGAVKVSAHRMRRRFRDQLTAQVFDTIADGECVEDELQALLAAVRKKS